MGLAANQDQDQERAKVLAQLEEEEAQKRLKLPKALMLKRAFATIVDYFLILSLFSPVLVLVPYFDIGGINESWQAFLDFLVRNSLNRDLQNILSDFFQHYLDFVAYFLYFAITVGGFLLVTLVYFSYFYGKHFASPGKRFFQLKIYDSSNGRPLGIIRTVFRETLGKLLCLCSLIGIFIGLFHSKGKMLHDVLFRSCVGDVHPRWRVKVIEKKSNSPSSLN